jgi:SAM-dependent MidA family methyltransferase
MGSPVPFTLCEVGAGTGSLTADLLGAAADANAPWIGAVDVVLVERSATPETMPGWRLRRTIEEVAPFEGLLIANELLDNLPIRLVVDDTEIRVGESGGELAFVPEPDPDRLRPDPVGVRRFLDQVARVLLRGYVLLIDYSGSGIRTFAGHGLSEDLLDSPGDRDVTASVDWAVVEDEAQRRGLKVNGRQPQRDLLMQLGLTTTLGSLRDAELEAVRAQDHWASLRFRDQWTRATALVDPAGPGGFEALLLGRDVPPGLPWGDSAVSPPRP